MTLLTPNFTDKLKNDSPHQGNGATPHITQAHEPLVGETMIQEMNWPFLTAPTLEQNGNVSTVAEPEPLKVALIGTAPSSRMLAPFKDPSWKIWACSPGNQGILPRVDAWFELHGNLLWPENEHYGRPYIEWLKQQKFPIYMQDQSFVPNAISFPMKEMVAEFGGDFFTSSFTWMMALAIHNKASEIALYGIDMASRDEYILQRPGFFFFKYLAQRNGIKVTAPNESDILQPPGLYGWSDVTPFGRKTLARETELKGRIAQMDQQIGSLTNQRTYLQGALEDVDYFKSIWAGAQNNSPTPNGQG